VLVIIAMAATLVAPAVDAGFRAREVRSAVRMIAGTMRTLQADAVRTGNVQGLAIDPFGEVLQLDNGKEILLGDTARIMEVKGGELQRAEAWSVSFYPNGSNTGIDLLVGERGAPPTRASGSTPTRSSA
jgi:Tfp pilus assembly protein FimT